MDRVLEFLHLSIGFSLAGLVVFLLPMVPNLLFLVLQNPNGDSTVARDHPMLDLVEHGSQGVFAVLLIFLVGRSGAPLLSGLTVAMSLLLLAYFGLWVAYFTVGATFPLLMFMAIVPVLYLLIAEVWLHNPAALVFTALFGVAHVATTYLDYH